MSEQYETHDKLIERLVNSDDPRDWEMFVRDYRSFIHAILTRMNVNRSDRDDLSQEILIKLHENLSQYVSEKGNFHAWLASVIRNTVRNHFAKQARSRENLEKYAEARDIEGHAMSAMDRAIQEEWKNHLLSLALKRVGEVVSENVLNCFKMTLDNVPAEEIAERLGLTIGTVYVTRSRVRSHVQAELKALIRELGS